MELNISLLFFSWRGYERLYFGLSYAIKKLRYIDLKLLLSIISWITRLAAPFEEGDGKPFWKNVRALRKDNTSIARLKQGSVLHSDGLTKAHILNKQFSSVFAPPDNVDIPVRSGLSFSDIGELITNVHVVTKLLLNVKPNKASDPDNIPCRLLKEAVHEISPVLTDIFNSSLWSNSLSKDWKLACITLVFKKGNTNEPANYRPISLTCICSKLLEHIVCHHVRDHRDKLPSKSLVHLIHMPISQHPKYTLLSKFLDLFIIMLSLINHRCSYALVMTDCTGSLEIDRHRKIHFTKWNLAIFYMPQRCHFTSHYHASLRKSKGNSIWSITSRSITSGCGTLFWCPCEDHTAHANRLYATPKL